MKEFFNSLKQERYLFRHYPLLWIHIGIPLLGVLLLSLYFLGADQENEILSFMIMISLAYPFAIGVVCGVSAGMEWESGYLHRMNTFPGSPAISHLAKLAYLLWTGLLAVVFAAIVFVLLHYEWNVQKILIIDDEKELSKIMKKALEKDGYKISIWESGEEKRVSDFEGFDLILLDIMMPKIDGFTILKNIRDKLDIPILFVTAKVLDQDIVEGFHLGADDYIKKLSVWQSCVQEFLLICEEKNDKIISLYEMISIDLMFPRGFFQYEQKGKKRESVLQKANTIFVFIFFVTRDKFLLWKIL